MIKYKVSETEYIIYHSSRWDLYVCPNKERKTYYENANYCININTVLVTPLFRATNITQNNYLRFIDE